MPYILAIVFVAVAVALFFLTVWGGILWLIVGGVALSVVFLGRVRQARFESSDPRPTGRPRPSHGGADTANRRVGQE